jgi:protein-S-isoprenylcysteine O-methyltransferase Ste14
MPPFLLASCSFICPVGSCRGRELLSLQPIGTVIALWCVFTFVFIGKGTPAPFDPPRKLVIRGPYRFVRNPMYIGAGMSLAGAALYYESLSILIYAGLFFLITHLFVVLYEEPTLRRTFGDEYEAYCQRVRRWRPHRSKK